MKIKHKFIKRHFILEKINRYSLKKKMLILQIFCVILPLLITDSVIISMLLNEEKKANVQEMNDIAEAVANTVNETEESTVSMMQAIYFNREINEFLKERFQSPLDYYNKRYALLRDYSYKIAVSGLERSIVTIYSNSIGTINGGAFQSINKIQNEEWYQKYSNEQQDVMLFADYSKVNWETRRNVFFIRKLNYFDRQNDNILRVDLDYSGLARKIINAKFASTVYVCEGDRIIFSNEGKGGLYAPYKTISQSTISKSGAHLATNLYNTTWDIYVMPGKNIVYEALYGNRYFICFLFMMNVVFPFVMFHFLSQSFTQRLHTLDEALRKVEKNGLYTLPEISGSDEISMLMKTYNEMAEKLNALIENEYKNKLKRQESDIARQRAELLALHSQINPHFLFNALESIRMHSVIKKETETACMVEKLALIHRQNVEWGSDLVTVSNEVQFVEAYLELQKYRFGNKLTCEVSVDEDCKDCQIPKLSLVTFVENACVHGMEKKTSACWIFVRISKNDTNVIMEIEDTGSGMTEEMRRNLEEAINHVDMDMLRENHRIGILNAALRLKMFFKDQVCFELDSEPGAGTLVTIKIDLESIEQVNLQRKE